MIHSSSGIGVAGQRLGILSLLAIGASLIGGAPADGEAGSDSSSREGVAPPDWESSWVAATGIGEGSALTSEVEGMAPPDWESRLVAARGIGEGSALTSTSESAEAIVGSVLQVAAAGGSEVEGGFL